MIKTNVLIDRISDRIFLERSLCKEVIDAFIDEIKDSLINGEEVSMPSFVTFKLHKRDAFIGTVAATGEKVFYPESNIIKCLISETFKRCIRIGTTYLPLSSEEAQEFQKQKEAEEKIKNELNRDNSPRVKRTDYKKLTERSKEKEEAKKRERALYGKEDNYSDYKLDE